MKIIPIRWSAISSFEYSPPQWYKTYILGIQQTSPELTFGSFVDQKIQDDPTFIPSLPRYPIIQYGMKTRFARYLLTGTADGVDLDNFLLCDYKTGVKEWDQKRADTHGQLDMYLLMIYLIKKIPPEKFRCFIHWLPTQKEEWKENKTIISFRDNPVVPITFETKRTMLDLVKFCDRINKIAKEMEEYVKLQSSIRTVK